MPAPKTQPICEPDSEIRAAIANAHFPSLAAALVHLTGDPALIRSGMKPVYEFFGDGQGGLTPEQKYQIADVAVSALAALRDERANAPAPLAPAIIREIMNFVAGAEIPE